VSLYGNPRWGDAGTLITFIPALIEDLVEGARVGGRLDKEMNRLVQRLFGLIRSISRTHHILRHGVGNKLVAFPPNVNRKFDVQSSRHVATSPKFSPREL
jgi:hypothetical protein